MSNKWKGTPIIFDPKKFSTLDEEPSDESEKYRDYEGNPSAHDNPDNKGRNGDNEYVR